MYNRPRCSILHIQYVHEYIHTDPAVSICVCAGLTLSRAVCILKRRSRASGSGILRRVWLGVELEWV